MGCRNMTVLHLPTHEHDLDSRIRSVLSTTDRIKAQRTTAAATHIGVPFLTRHIGKEVLLGLISIVMFVALSIPMTAFDTFQFTMENGTPTTKVGAELTIAATTPTDDPTSIDERKHKARRHANAT